jgi:hypothetical protein
MWAMTCLRPNHPPARMGAAWSRAALPAAPMPTESASRATVSHRGARCRPHSSAATAAKLLRARSAKSSRVKPAVRRHFPGPRTPDSTIHSVAIEWIVPATDWQVAWNRWMFVRLPEESLYDPKLPLSRPLWGGTQALGRHPLSGLYLSADGSRSHRMRNLPSMERIHRARSLIETVVSALVEGLRFSAESAIAVVWNSASPSILAPCAKVRLSVSRLGWAEHRHRPHLTLTSGGPEG